jgi:hypothetical protein
MDLTKIRASLNGVNVNLPEEWQGLQLQASFENDNIQANIQTEEFTFVDEAREEIERHIKLGYFYEGLPFKLQVNKGNLNYLAFEGYLDLQSSYTKLSTDRVVSRIQKLSGLNTFGEKISGLTFGYLDSLGIIKSVDVEYLVEKRKNFLEIVMTSLMIYLMIKELAELTRRLADNIISFISLLTGGGTFTSIIGSALLLAGKILLDIAYGAIMVKAIIEMTEELMKQFISPVKKYKCCSFFELMRATCQHLGYNFSSSITDLKLFHNLPSNPYEDKIETGVPRVEDSSLYNCGDFFNVMSRMFDAKIGIIGDTVYFENLDSDFWVTQSTYELPDVFTDSVRKNGEELAGTRLVSYQTDPLDEWTVENIKGTFYEIKTLQQDYRNGIEYLTINSVDDRVLPYALPNRKNNLNDLERLLKELGQIVDNVVNAFGGSSNLASKVQSRVGMLLLGTDVHSVPRIIPLSGGKLPTDYRDLVSAKTIYEKYIKASSFVLSKNGGQKEVYEGVRVLFGFEDFLQLIENSYFRTSNGSIGKVINVNWTIDKDFAEIDYWIKDPNPTDKLIEEYIEPE